MGWRYHLRNLLVMNIKDTIKGEIYTCQDNNNKVFIYTCGKSGEQYYLNFICDIITSGLYAETSIPTLYRWNGLRESTPQEIHWLNECIKRQNDLSFDEAMKTFNSEPQYEIY